MSGLRELIDQANKTWAPQERPFTSSAPVVGPVIVSLRRVLNWMSAKWYVRPILEQQIAFNSTIVQTLNEMSKIVEEISTRTEQEHARVSEVESALNNQVRESEDMAVLADRANVSLAREVARLRHVIARAGAGASPDMVALGEAVRRLEKALSARGGDGGTDADSLL